MDRRHLLPALRSLILVGLLLLFAISLISALIGSRSRETLATGDGSDPGIHVLLRRPDDGLAWQRITIVPLQECLLYTPRDKSLAQTVAPSQRIEIVAQGRDGIEVRLPGVAEPRLWPTTELRLISRRLDPGQAISRLAAVEALPREAVFMVAETGRRYRGHLELRLDWSTGLHAINMLPVEAWLEGVLQSELPAGWPTEAFAAQAVAARSHAVAAIVSKQRDRDDGIRFDVSDGGLDPAYHGTGSGHRKIVTALEQTSGEILTHFGRPFTAYVHAASGGHTAAVTTLVPDATTADGQRSLQAVMPAREDRFYEAGLAAVSDPERYDERRAVIEVGDLREALRAAGLGAERFRQISAERGPGGHVERVTLHRDSGDLQLSGQEFRTLAGPERVRSTLWGEDSPRLEYGEITITTYGRGHGVGMSQISALAMAEAGHRYREILGYFYHHADVQRWW